MAGFHVEVGSVAVHHAVLHPWLRTVMLEFLIWITAYYLVFAVYHFALTEEWKGEFRAVAKHINTRLDYLSLSFILGFFVNLVVDRWKRMFDNIGFIDSACLTVNAYIRPNAEATNKEMLRVQRRTIARWLCLAQVLVLRDVSVRVRKRFPTLEAVQEAGYLEPAEMETISQTAEATGFQVYWMPFNWVYNGLARLREMGVIRADPLLANALLEIRAFREQMQMLCNYDWVPVPLVYSQIVFVSVRIYFLLCLVARQSFTHLEEMHAKTTGSAGAEMPTELHYYIPFMTIIQFVIFMAWLKVAEVLLNPFGEDDDDFECDFVIDRNITVAMLLADKFHDTVGEMVEDRFMGMDHPLYSENSANIPQHPLVGSAAKLEAKGYLPSPKEKIRMVPRAPLEDLQEANDTAAPSVLTQRRKFASTRESTVSGGITGWRGIGSRVRNSLPMRPKRVVPGERVVEDADDRGKP